MAQIHRRLGRMRNMLHNRELRKLGVLGIHPQGRRTENGAAPVFEGENEFKTLSDMDPPAEEERVPLTQRNQEEERVPLTQRSELWDGKSEISEHDARPEAHSMNSKPERHDVAPGDPNWTPY